jgi:protein-L-isoaspartate O-methyltransferase
MKQQQTLLVTLIKKTLNFYWFIFDMFAYKFNRIGDMYYNKFIGTAYRREYADINISKYQKVLHIGCGVFPLTEMTIVSSTGAQVVGIDRNSKVLPAARDIIQRKQMEGKIQVVYGNGINYPVDGFDVIIISSCATPILQILDHVIHNAKGNAMIIIREVETAVRPLIKYLDAQNNIKIMKKIGHYGFPFPGLLGWQAFYILKKG